VVESVLFAGEGEEGLAWRVVRLRPSGVGAPFVATGLLPKVDEGLELRLAGEWVEHPRHGRQFKAQEVEVLPPSTRTGVLRYLSSGTIKGVGPKLAERIVNALGEQALEKIEGDPQVLLQVSGIGPAKAASVAAALQAQAQSRAALVCLRGLGLGEAMARKVYQAYGARTAAAIQANPFRLAQEVIGLGFRRSDQIARNLGVPADSLHRLIDNGEPYDIELKIRRLADGEVAFIRSTAEYDPHTQTVFGTLMDITEHARLISSLPAQSWIIIISGT